MLPAGSPLSDWLDWLETLSPNEIDLGLERVQSVLSRLSLKRPEEVLLVAGTNGKGSCIAIATALLQRAGYRVGAYTSPHISRYNERIAIDGVALSDARIIASFEQVEAARHEVPLTYFEYGTLAAVAVFAAADLDVWILEVGMGGRLDACNAIDPTASLITNVSLDHCDWLGNDIETIAVEKAGVMRRGMPTVFGSPHIPRSLAQHAETIGADLLQVGRDFDFEGGDEGHWHWTGRETERRSLPLPGLRGDFQIGNAAAVLALLEAAGLGRALRSALLAEVLPNVSIAGRLQAVTAAGAEWLLDVAHNPAAAEVLAAELAARSTIGNTWAIIGALCDKDIGGIVRPLNDEVDYWIAVTASSPRAVPADELARQVSNMCGRPCRISDSLSDAMEYARHSAMENDRILVTGSFYLVGPALQCLALYSRPQT